MVADNGSTGAVKLVGYNNFVRHNPKSDKFTIHRFHHVEFWCADATNTYKRFQHGLGMTLVAKSDQSTGNCRYASYVLQSNDLVFSFTAPYSRKAPGEGTSVPFAHYKQQDAFDFIMTHGMAVRAVGLLVADAAEAYHTSVKHGAKGVLEPIVMQDLEGGKAATISEVGLYGDVVLRFISGDYQGPYLPGYAPTPEEPAISFGLQRLDHAVGNVPQLLPAVNHIIGFTGFHEFAEFVAEDVGTVDSGLNSMVLANNNELVLLPINEPTFGTPRKSQIQTYLEQNEGAGLQHLALKTNDIFHTLREMSARSRCGGFDFMPRPSDKYYKELPAKIGDDLTPEQYKECEELGILVDKDDQGVLLQIFTKPLGDRPTVFIEIIQRLGCLTKVPPGATNGATHTADSLGPAAAVALPAAAEAAAGKAEEGPRFADVVAKEADGTVVEQAAGCGGFGKGNFSELFKSIEDYERTLQV